MCIKKTLIIHKEIYLEIVLIQMHAQSHVIIESDLNVARQRIF